MCVTRRERLFDKDIVSKIHRIAYNDPYSKKVNESEVSSIISKKQEKKQDSEDSDSDFAKSYFPIAIGVESYLVMRKKAKIKIMKFQC